MRDRLQGSIVGLRGLGAFGVREVHLAGKSGPVHPQRLEQVPPDEAFPAFLGDDFRHARGQAVQ